MKNIIVTGTSFFILGVVLGLIQLWFEPWSFAQFIKLEITLGALFFINLAIEFTRKEYKAASKYCRSCPRQQECAGYLSLVDPTNGL
jgi:hypothetical protein